MTPLALRSLRHRAPASAATAVAAFLGTALMGAFATLLETATGDVPAADAETLRVMGAVVGGWGTIIVLFSVASTLGVTVRERREEIGLLRTLGATPRQVRRLVRAEAAVVAGAAAVLGALLAWPAGALLLSLLRGAGTVSGEVAFGGGPIAVGSAAAAVTLTSVLAAAVTARRATAGPATLVLAEARADGTRVPRWRVAAGLALVAYGIATAVVTITVTADDPDPYAAMATSGSSCLLVGVGLAALAPVVLGWAGRLGRPVAGRSGAAVWLAAATTARRSGMLGGVLGPVVVLTAGAVGVLVLVGIDGRTLPGPVPEGETINLLNTLVTAMIVLFAAIMVVNAFAAVVAGRRPELLRLRLAGATAGQVRQSVLAEAGAVAAVGVTLGLVASLATIVPFAVARDEGVVPDGQLWLPPLLAAGAVLLTLGAARLAVARADVDAAPPPAALR